MKGIILAVTLLIGYQGLAIAQRSVVVVDKVLKAEDAFNKLVERKGIKDAFLAVADVGGIVFKPEAVNITEFYNSIDKQPGKLSWVPKFARISANGDLGFSAGPYVYQNGKSDTDKVYGEYVSIWRADAEGKLKLFIDLGIQHPEPDAEETTDFKDPDSSKQAAPSKDPFNGRNIILGTDKIFNHELGVSTMGTYQEFLSPEGRYYFPGFEPMTGRDRIMKFIDNEGIAISAETINVGRSTSNDLAYSYGHARIRKGDIVSNYNYVRIWEIDKNFKWNVLLEVFSAVEQ